LNFAVTQSTYNKPGVLNQCSCLVIRGGYTPFFWYEVGIPPSRPGVKLVFGWGISNTIICTVFVSYDNNMYYMYYIQISMYYKCTIKHVL
jgi:hypothetical protein